MVEGWYDFNDSGVTPILPGKLQSQFGGSSENAYMLVYKQKKLVDQSESLIGEKQKRPEVPQYWNSALKHMNEVAESERALYADLENQFEIILQDECLFKITEPGMFVNYAEDSKIDE